MLAVRKRLCARLELEYFSFIPPFSVICTEEWEYRLPGPIVPSPWMFQLQKMSALLILGALIKAFPNVKFQLPQDQHFETRPSPVPGFFFG